MVALFYIRKGLTMKNLLITLSLLLFITISRSENPTDITFSEEGVSFNYPNDWEIRDYENFYDVSKYLSVGKTGVDASGLFVIIWLKETADLTETLEIYKDSLKEQSLLVRSGLTFDEHHESQFNNITTLTTNYHFSLFGIEHEGIIHAFHQKDKTFTVVKQEASEDTEKNKKGFEIIESTFKIE